MLYIDNPNTGRHAILTPEFAVLSGAIRTDSVEDLRRFERAFPLDPRIVIAVAQEVLAERGVDPAIEPAKARVALSPKEKTDIVFKRLLPRVHRPAATPGWSATLRFVINGAGTYTVSAGPRGVKVADDAEGEVDARIETDAATFAAVMRFEALDDADLLDQIRIVADESGGAELSDASLELVAGGKGACAAAACGSDICGGAACGAAGGANNAVCGGAACGGAACATAVCVGAACGGAACTGDACGGDACLTATGVGAGCGSAQCGMAACGGDACGAAAGGTSGCLGAACGAAACSADVCAGAACGVEASIGGACAGNACGVDVAGGPDAGPCGVNVLPFVPFI